LVLVALIFFRLWWLMLQSRDWFSSFILLGTIFLMMIEIFMNAGMNLGLFPVVGIPFPFLSAGGSSLLAHFWLFGIVASIARFETAKGYRGSSTSLA
jgi:rod shape determining protein RodA